MASPGFLFRILAIGAPLPEDPVFALSASAYEARTMIAQVFGVEPGRVGLQLCPEGMRPPRDALVYRLQPGSQPLGDRWVLYRG